MLSYMFVVLQSSLILVPYSKLKMLNRRSTNFECWNP